MFLFLQELAWTCSGLLRAVGIRKADVQSILHALITHAHANGMLARMTVEELRMVSSVFTLSAVSAVTLALSHD